jgi:hypothetical protein
MMKLPGLVLPVLADERVHARATAAARVRVANPKLGMALSFASGAESSRRLTFHRRAAEGRRDRVPTNLHQSKIAAGDNRN